MDGTKIVVRVFRFDGEDRDVISLACACGHRECERGIWTYADNAQAVVNMLRYMASGEDACEYEVSEDD